MSEDGRRVCKDKDELFAVDATANERVIKWISSGEDMGLNWLLQ